jgi:hypothetical protein
MPIENFQDISLSAPTATADINIIPPAAVVVPESTVIVEESNQIMPEKKEILPNEDLVIEPSARMMSNFTNIHYDLDLQMESMMNSPENFKNTPKVDNKKRPKAKTPPMVKQKIKTISTKSTKTKSKTKQTKQTKQPKQTKQSEEEFTNSDNWVSKLDSIMDKIVTMFI